MLSGWLALVETAVGAEWVDVRQVGPFRCAAQFPADEIAPLLTDLANLPDDIAAHLELNPDWTLIEVYIFAGKGDYQRFLAGRFPDIPFRRALYVKEGDRALVLTYRSDDFGIDLRHECTHALLHAALPMVPLWLDEGLAEYFEVSPGYRSFSSPHLRRVRWQARLRRVPDLARLEQLGHMSDMGAREYREAWSWVHFLLHGPPEARNELRTYLERIRELTPPGRLSEHLESRFADLDRAYISHFLMWRE